MSESACGALEHRSTVAEAIREPLTDRAFYDMRNWIVRTGVVLFVGDQVRGFLRAQLEEEADDQPR